ncbi:hypothetical protein P7H15_21645 [Paenibacillus larvae]|nr:hypothetical protein [Paenibacillus larvae]MDT2294885.1 hypothetical protein [Paenibacillus larvae]
MNYLLEFIAAESWEPTPGTPEEEIIWEFLLNKEKELDISSGELRNQLRIIKKKLILKQERFITN